MTTRRPMGVIEAEKKRDARALATYLLRLQQRVTEKHTLKALSFYFHSPTTPLSDIMAIEVELRAAGYRTAVDWLRDSHDLPYGVVVSGAAI